MLSRGFLSILHLVYFSVRMIVIQLIIIENFTFCNQSAGLPRSLEKCGTSDLAQYFCGRLQSTNNVALALLDFDEIAEVPGKLLGKVEIVLNIFSVDVFVIEDAIQHPAVHDARIASDLNVVVRAVLELYALVEASLEVLGHENIRDGDLFAFTVPRLNNEFSATWL